MTTSLNSKPILIIFNTPHKITCHLFKIDYNDFMRKASLEEIYILYKETNNITLSYSRDFGFCIKCSIQYFSTLVEKLLLLFKKKNISLFTQFGECACQIKSINKKYGVDISPICKELGLLPPSKGDKHKLFGLYKSNIVIPRVSPYYSWSLKKKRKGHNNVSSYNQT